MFLSISSRPLLTLNDLRIYTVHFFPSNFLHFDYRHPFFFFLIPLPFFSFILSHSFSKSLPVISLSVYFLQAIPFSPPIFFLRFSFGEYKYSLFPSQKFSEAHFYYSLFPLSPFLFFLNSLLSILFSISFQVSFLDLTILSSLFLLYGFYYSLFHLSLFLAFCFSLPLSCSLAFYLFSPFSIYKSLFPSQSYSCFFSPYFLLLFSLSSLIVCFSLFPLFNFLLFSLPSLTFLGFLSP
ncbi:unnamed protein product [Acanthosepion pharaonis]|uniref:Uncharacterized protein n=1 Tax=Acanthosepion pharaonis TaxID=158019 RepID=A0A812C8D4_ACAPH|nr:unnamed protein product [Sepia pharaonis]